jgi:hypothetical protein
MDKMERCGYIIRRIHIGVARWKARRLIDVLLPFYHLPPTRKQQGAMDEPTVSLTQELKTCISECHAHGPAFLSPALNLSQMFKLVEDIHHCFISEESPNDPDFQNVYSTYAHARRIHIYASRTCGGKESMKVLMWDQLLCPCRHHTHVGIGLAAGDAGVRYVELYTSRYATLSEAMPLHLGSASSLAEGEGEEGGEGEPPSEAVVLLEGTVFEPEVMGPFGVVVYREAHPGMLAIDELQVRLGVVA